MVITRYNETNADHRAVALTNSIGTVSPTFVGVGFSHPSGVFKINDFVNFTHFTAEFGGVTYIYKVTGFHAVNSTVREVTYTLDYMKDWFSKNAWSNLKGAVVVKSNNTADRSPFIVDNEFLADGTSSVWNRHIGGNGTWDLPTDGGVSRFGRYVVVVSYPYGSNNMPCIACGMTATEFGRFALAMLNTEGESMAKQIKAAYYCPFWDLISSSIRVAGTVQYMRSRENGGAVNTKTEPFRPLDASGNIDENGTIACEYIYGSSSSLIAPRASLPSVDDDPIDDFIDLDLTTRQAYIPYYGTVDVPSRNILKYYSNNAPYLDYRVVYMLSPFDGTVAFYWDAAGGETIPSDYRALPKLTIPSGAMAVQLTNAIQQRETYENFAKVGAVMSGFTLQPVLDTGGFIKSTLAAAQNIANSQNTLNAIARSGIDYAMQASGWGSFNESYMLLNEIKPVSVTYATRCAHAGYPCNKMAVNVTPVTNKRYLIDTKYMEVNGLDWYADGVRSDISGEYIYYNK